jgi:hypothetical protein
LGCTTQVVVTCTSASARSVSPTSSRGRSEGPSDITTRGARAGRRVIGSTPTSSEWSPVAEVKTVDIASAGEADGSCGRSSNPTAMAHDAAPATSNSSRSFTLRPQFFARHRACGPSLGRDHLTPPLACQRPGPPRDGSTIGGPARPRTQAAARPAAASRRLVGIDIPPESATEALDRVTHVEGQVSDREGRLSDIEADVPIGLGVCR